MFIFPAQRELNEESCIEATGLLFCFQSETATADIVNISDFSLIMARAVCYLAGDVQGSITFSQEVSSFFSRGLARTDILGLLLKVHRF